MLIESFERRPTYVQAVKYEAGMESEITTWLMSLGIYTTYRLFQFGQNVNYIDVGDDWDTADHVTPGHWIVYDPQSYGNSAVSEYTDEEFDRAFRKF